MDLSDTCGRVQPVPGLGEAHEVHHVRTHGKRRTAGDNGDETSGVRRRPAEQFTAGIHCDLGSSSRAACAAVLDGR